eukprot:2230137-Pyramimonas_sp.AAC.1
MCSIRRFLIVPTSCSGYICCDNEAHAMRCTLGRPVPSDVTRSTPLRPARTAVRKTANVILHV